MSEQSKEPVTPEDAAPQAEVAAPPTEAQAADGAEQERAPDDGATARAVTRAGGPMPATAPSTPPGRPRST